MPYPSQHSHTRSEAEPTAEAPADAPADEARLGGFALLADPATIASGVEAEAPATGGDEASIADTPPATDCDSAGDPADQVAQNAPQTLHDDEIERLQHALRLQSQEIETLREKWGHSTGAKEASADEDHVAAHRRGSLLDAASARRLAADARNRERASREALEAAQQSLAVEAQDRITGDHEGSALEAIRGAKIESEVREDAPRWQRLPLVARKVATTPRVDRAPAPQARETAPESEPDPTTQKILRAAHAEIRALETTLAIARQTTVEQREDLASLRGALADRDARLARLESEREQTQPLPERASRPEPVEASEATPPRALERARAEIERLAERVATLEHDLDSREGEQRRLERTLEERSNLADARSSQIDSLNDRLEAQDRALDAARREYELERDRHTQSLDLLKRLRATLSGDLDPLVARPVTEEPPHTSNTSAIATEALDTPDAEARASLSGAADATAAPDEETLPVPGFEVLHRDPAETHERSEQAHAVFDLWHDDQVRRHFGPMGIDRLTDLLRAPLERRSANAKGPLDVLLVGRDAWHGAGRFAEGLLAAGPLQFLLHVASPPGGSCEDDLAIPFDSPLRDYIVPFDPPETPEAFRAAVEALRPAALVSRDFLSHEVEAEPWLDVLEGLTHAGGCLLLAEETGLGQVDVPPALREIGDRIWELMPERYTRFAGADRIFERFEEAFDARPERPANALYERARTRFQFELSAQFGFLADAFVRSPIAPNFDGRAVKDQRFLRQVSDLDDRKIEAGAATALHWVGLVEPLSED